jgi:hypothetical protein
MQSRWLLIALLLIGVRGTQAAQAQQTSEGSPNTRGGSSAASSSSSKASENYKPDGDYLPGETVKTPTGQQIKVWSTQGPVETRYPPYPGPAQVGPPQSGQPGGVYPNGDIDVIIDGRGDGRLPRREDADDGS